MSFFLMSQGSFIPIIMFRSQKVCSVVRKQTDRHTDRHTDTKVNTEDTLSGFHEFFLQPIINNRSNIITKVFNLLTHTLITTSKMADFITRQPPVATSGRRQRYPCVPINAPELTPLCAGLRVDSDNIRALLAASRITQVEAG